MEGRRNSFFSIPLFQKLGLKVAPPPTEMGGGGDDTVPPHFSRENIFFQNKLHISKLLLITFINMFDMQY